MCLLLIAAVPLMAADRVAYCKDARELASITEQLPGYVISSDADTPAQLIPPMKLRAHGLLGASHGFPVCIAVVVDESGKALDAAAYTPKRVALSKRERATLLAQHFTPALQDGIAVKSIFLITVRGN